MSVKVADGSTGVFGSLERGDYGAAPAAFSTVPPEASAMSETGMFVTRMTKSSS
ncbi:MAG: hypothetical protein R3D65_14945 [Zhengella sp.]|uniref:hypothetical protein n=1 Tax=Zhengella sp. TaxID=2282762 RepID=UPI003528E0BD